MESSDNLCSPDHFLGCVKGCCLQAQFVLAEEGGLPVKLPSCSF
ncbi:MAG: hypothetical protein ACJASJ_000748 [Candidatus Azotimanducaceae bacterium]